MAPFLIAIFLCELVMDHINEASGIHCQIIKNFGTVPLKLTLFPPGWAQ